MIANDETSFVVKVKFEEKTQNMVGFLLLLFSAKDMALVKCDIVVNYYTEMYVRQFNIFAKWVTFLERIGDAKSDVTESFLEDFAEQMKVVFRLYPRERIAKLAEIVLDVTDPNLKKVMMTDILKEDLEKVFVRGELNVEFAMEVIGKKKEDEETGTPQEAAGTEQRPDSPGGFELTAQQQGQEAAPTVSVEPVIDPIDGVPSSEMKIGDVVNIITGQVNDLSPEAKVISLFTAADSDRIVVQLELSNELKGQMILSKNMLVKVVGGGKRRKSFDFSQSIMINVIIAFLAILALVLMVFLIL